MNSHIKPLRPNPFAGEQGFTLVEMLVVLAVSATLVSVTIPLLRTSIDSVKVSSASNDLIAGVHLARGEAIKRNVRVALCKSADGETCASTGGWEQGWIVFEDANNSGAREPSEKIIQREMPLSSSLRMTGNQNVARYISFTPTGATKTVGGGFQAGTLTVCRQSDGAAPAREIVLNAVGRPRVQKTTVASCA